MVPLHIGPLIWYFGLAYPESLTSRIELILQGGAALWCIGFQKIQGQGITILGGIDTTQSSFNSWNYLLVKVIRVYIIYLPKIQES